MKYYMLRFLFFCLTLLLVYKNTDAQITTVLSAGQQLAEKAAQKSSAKKKSKLADKYTSLYTLNGESVPLMRVPAAQIKGMSKNQILKVQGSLDVANADLKAGRHIKNTDELERDIRLIQLIDSDWIIQHYLTECLFYRHYETDLTAKENEIRAQKQRREKFVMDSIQHERKMAEIKLQNQLKITRDSIERIRLAEFHAKERERDSIQATKRIIIPPPATTSAPISNFSPSKTPSTKTGKSTPKTGRRYSSHTYYTGPRGGCYYINADGKKIYVDHSYCQ
jgi:hypothetical protein